MLFYFDMDDNDANLLHHFFKQTRLALGRLLREGLWGEFRVEFIHNNRQQLAQAWAEEVEPEFDRAHKAIDKVFESARPVDERLRTVGLTGLSLRAKLQSIVDWSRLAMDGLGGALWGVLKGLNIILGSFAFAEKVGDAIDEMKQLIENSIWPDLMGPLRR